MANNKLYKSSVIKDLQNAINTNQCIIKPYKDWNFIESGFRSCGIFMRFIKNPSTGFLEKYMSLPDELNNEVYKTWKQFPIYKFLYKDIRNNNRDFLENTPYNFVQYIVNDKKYYALIRKLIEITSDELSEENKIEFIKEYCDIIIDSRYYSIVKICPAADEFISWAIDDKKSMLAFNPTPAETSNISSDNTEDEYYNDNTSENIEDPLF